MREVAKVATIHFDGGGQSPGPVTAACTVQLSDGSFDKDVKRFTQGTHNTAEWHALILGLRMALAHGARHVVVYGDSMLVVKQINREWKTKHAALQPLRSQAEELLALFESWRVEWVPRMENRRADELGRMTSEDESAAKTPRNRRAKKSPLKSLLESGSDSQLAEHLLATVVLSDASWMDRAVERVGEEDAARRKGESRADRIRRILLGQEAGA